MNQRSRVAAVLGAALVLVSLQACKRSDGPIVQPTVTVEGVKPDPVPSKPEPAPSAPRPPAAAVSEPTRQVPSKPKTAKAARESQPDCLPSAPAVPKAPPPPFALSGRLGLWVAQVDPRSLTVLKAVGTNPDSRFPLASTYKQAVLWALLKEFDAGRVQPTERFDVTRSNQSLGAYPFDGMNVRDLSTRMIQWSDNTATDILHRRVGLRNVQQVVDTLGLCQTRVILPTRDWWVSQAGLSDTFNGTRRWASARGPEQAKWAALIDRDARQYRADYIQRKLDQYFDHRYQIADDFKVHNLSTPYEWGTLLSYFYLRPDLSPRARRWEREVMATGFGRYALKAQAANNVEWFGGKGGNGWRILTYSGYFRTKDGRHVVYAFMQHGSEQTYTMPNTRRAFAWINSGIDAVLGVQQPCPVVPKVPKSVKTAPPGSAAAKAHAEAVKGAKKPLPAPPSSR